MTRRRPSPILVTGMPRSGTTWLARLLSCSPGTALAGREPMNPRGAQYALGRSLTGWTRLEDPSPRQCRQLRATYQGLNPLAYSRYGKRQWAGPLPWTRLVVKDPFAMLSLPTLQTVTGALPIIVYRHPGAMLASFRRVGWTAQPREVLAAVRSSRSLVLAGGESGSWPDDELGAMGTTWSTLYQAAVTDAGSLSACVIVSHEELAAGGPSAARRLFEACSLDWDDSAARLFTVGPAGAGESSALHNFDRTPAEVARAWRDKVDADEIARLEAGAGDVLHELETRRLHHG